MIAIILAMGLLACEKDKGTPPTPPRPPKMINIPLDYPTIQQGINASVDGDTIIVQPGTYVENINFNGHNILLGSLFLTTGEMSYISTTIIDGDSAGTVVIFSEREDTTCTLAGFTIQNGKSDVGGGIYCYKSSPALNNNVIINNYAEHLGGGIILWDSNPTITNNTIYRNSASYSGGGCYIAYSIPTFINNILWGNSAQDGPEIYSMWYGSPIFEFCDIQGGWEGEGNIDCNPSFCYPDTGNYSLADSSCCVGIGQNSENIGAYGIGCE